jgi:AraC-like DNA-binding protein
MGPRPVPVEPPSAPPPRSGSRGTILATMFQAVLAAAEAAGLSRAQLLKLTGVSAGSLTAPEARVPQPAYMRLWEEIERRVDAPCFGLRFSESQVGASTFSVVGFAARSSRTYGEALRRVARYSRLLNDTEEFTLDLAGDTCVIGQNPRGLAPPWPRHKAESAMTNYVVLGRAWTGRTWSPIEVSFVHARPRDTSEHRRIFGCPARFGRPRNELRIDASLLALPQIGASPDLGDYLSQHAEKLLSTLAPQTLLDDVHRAVRDALPDGPPELSAIARRLGLSPRSLQRRLAEEGTTFARLVDETRRAVALELLSDRRVTIEEIAFLLGFADVRGFRRAFERWTGTSPRAFRAAGADLAR